MSDSFDGQHNTLTMSPPEPSLEPTSVSRGKKSEAIRQYLKDHGWNTPAKEVANALCEDGIEINQQLVYSIQSRHKQGAKEKIKKNEKSLEHPNDTKVLSQTELVTLVRLLRKAQLNPTLRHYINALVEI